MKFQSKSGFQYFSRDIRMSSKSVFSVLYIIITYLVLGFITLSPKQLLAQTSEIDSLIDEVFLDEEDISKELFQDKNYHFLYLSSDYDNKTFYAGREVGVNQYNLTSQITYFNTTGIYAGVTGAWYSQLYPKYTTTIISVGYGKSFMKNKNFRLGASYNTYVYNYNDAEYEPTFKSSLKANASIKNSWIGTRFDISLLMGKEYSTNLSSVTYSKIKLFKKGGFKLQFEPEISLFFGSELIEYELITRFNIPRTLTKNAFGLMNTEISLPLAFSYKDFDLDLSYNFNFPRSLDPNYKYGITSFLNISIGYIFDFN